MEIITKRIRINSNGENDLIDITTETKEIVSNAKIQDGLVTVFVSGSTAAVTTIECE
jgi:thiamine phosphate synthase YjbQ (UPF0047 family)